MTDIIEANIYELKANLGTLSPDSVWEESDKWAKRETKSRERWDKMSDDTREVTLEIVDRALDRMRDRLEQWVPSSLEIKEGNYMDVSFRVLFTELDAELRAKDEITQRRIKEASEGTDRIIEEVTGVKPD